MSDYSVRQSIADMEEYSVEIVEADIIVNANESNYPIPEEIGDKISALVKGFPFNRYPPMKSENLGEAIAKEFDVDPSAVVVSNGSSELLSNVSVSIVNILYNHQLLKYLGNQGVAAYGVIQYVCFVFMAIFFGFMLGVGPLISFNFGAKNREELRNIFRKSLIIILIAGFVMTCLGEATARPLALAFVKSNPDLCDLTTRGFILFSFGFSSTPL